MKIVIYAVVLIIFIALAYGGFLLQRKIHFMFGYQTMVEQEIRDHVKQECLQ